MRSTARFFAAAAALVLSSTALPTRADDVAAPAIAARPTETVPPMTVKRAVDSILDAGSPSSAIDAYFYARKAAPRRVTIAQAYVRRMTEFDVAEVAEPEARDILKEEMSDGLSRAVVAATRAKRGDAGGAVAGIASAVSSNPEEPFVRRTAGQILAWHDTRTGRMAEDLESSIELMRTAVAKTPECAEAYRRAHDAYVAARGETAPRAAAPAAAAAPAPAVAVRATILPDSVSADFEDVDAELVVEHSSWLSCCYLPCDFGYGCATSAWYFRPTCASRLYTYGYGSRYGSGYSCGARSYGGWGTTTRGGFSCSSWGRGGGAYSYSARSSWYGSSACSPSYSGRRYTWRNGRRVR